MEIFYMYINDWFGWDCFGYIEFKKCVIIYMYVVEVFGLYIFFIIVFWFLMFFNLIGE